MHQKRRNYAKNSVQKEIFKTLTYSGIFDYPLTTDQVYKYLGTKIQIKKLLDALKKIPHAIVKNKLYYFLPGQEFIVAKRIKKEKINNLKIEKAKSIAQQLARIPTIKFIGVSGSLALKNADTTSDIDLFFIAENIWLTRFLVYVLLGNMRRKRKDKSSNLFCPNMFIDARKLQLKKQNLYHAHEIVQILPLINKENTFQRFLNANKWYKKFLPNFPLPKNKISKQATSTTKPFFSLMEFFFRLSQLYYLRSHQTTEITTPYLIAFHPVDYEGKILDEYNKRIRKI